MSEIKFSSNKSEASSGNFRAVDLCTAIISDLHLCEAEPVNAKFPLWKKFKTREFFFDEQFLSFLELIENKANGRPLELVLNGDIFDFDSVMTMPENPLFRISWLEKKRGLYPRPERARFKLQVIWENHELFFQGLRSFIIRGNRVVLIAGNHDLELHFPEVRDFLIQKLSLPAGAHDRFRFCEWFYISNSDTLVEHGNQYDPYCLCENPIQPFSQGYNFKTMSLPFGNLACRYILNGMGFFNPHVEANYIMSLKEYVLFFFKYIVRAQPFLIFSWLFGSVVTLVFSFLDRFRVPIRDPLSIEDRIDDIARRAKATPRMVRELRELFAPPATSNPLLIARELWLDRAFLFLFTLIFLIQVMILIRQVADISMWWMLIPYMLLLPFFLFYSKSVISLASTYKEPDEHILAAAGQITGVNRVIYGHTHKVRHEMIGGIEHLNSGCWSPAFLDVECTKSIDQKTFVWIETEEIGQRKAQVLRFHQGSAIEQITKRKIDTNRHS